MAAGPAQDVERVGVLERLGHLIEAGDVQRPCSRTPVWHKIPSNPIKNLQFPSGTVGAVAARFAYPVTLDLHGVVVLVVGAGPVAARKVAGLAEAGAVVRVVAPDVSAAMTTAVECRPRRHARPPTIPAERPRRRAPRRHGDRHRRRPRGRRSGDGRRHLGQRRRPPRGLLVHPARRRPQRIGEHRRQHRRHQSGARPAAPRRGRQHCSPTTSPPSPSVSPPSVPRSSSRADRPRTTDWSAEIDAVLGPPTSSTVR